MAKSTFSFFFFLFSFAFCSSLFSQQNGVQYWLTTSDRSQLLRKQTTVLRFVEKKLDPNAIIVDDSKTYQTIDGFGFALTGGSAQHIIQMDAADRKKYSGKYSEKNRMIFR